jgi:hypothetical protein
LCRDTRALAMGRCTVARLHRFVVVVVVLLVIVVPIVALIVIRRVADRHRVVVIVVAGTGTGCDAVAQDSGHERIAMRCRQDHCGGMRSFCPG